MVDISGLGNLFGGENNGGNNNITGNGQKSGSNPPTDSQTKQTEPAKKATNQPSPSLDLGNINISTKNDTTTTPSPKQMTKNTENKTNNKPTQLSFSLGKSNNNITPPNKNNNQILQSNAGDKQTTDSNNNQPQLNFSLGSNDNTTNDTVKNQKEINNKQVTADNNSSTINTQPSTTSGSDHNNTTNTTPTPTTKNVGSQPSIDEKKKEPAGDSIHHASRATDNVTNTSTTLSSDPSESDIKTPSISLELDQKMLNADPKKETNKENQPTSPKKNNQKGDEKNGEHNNGQKTPPNNVNQHTTLDALKGKIQKPTINKKRKVKPVNTKALVIGCGIFLLLITGIVAGGLYFFTNNPDKIGGIISLDTVKSLLKVFSVIFFGFLFILGFIIAVLNGHKLTVAKNVRKGGFIVGIFFGIFILLLATTGGFYVLDHINKLTDAETTTSTDLLFIEVPLKGGNQYLHKMPHFKLIAPMALKFSLNPDIINKVIAEKIGNNTLQGLSLDCGNGQTLYPTKKNWMNFASTCLFQKKGKYELTTTFYYTDKETNSPKESTLTQSLSFASQISLSTSQGAYTLNDAKTEISMSKAPQKVFFNAREVFSDLGIGNYDISWDVDADGKYDVINDVDFAHIYTEPKLQTVYFTIPGLGDYVYTLLFRVDQSDVPICTIQNKLIKDTTYTISANCTKDNGPIVSYNYTILKKQNTSYKEIDSINSDKNNIRYTFPTKGQYIVQMKFLTQEDKKGKAESNMITVGDIDFKLNYDIKYRGGEEKNWTSFGAKGKHTFDRKKPKITLGSLPVVLQFDVISIDPIVKNTDVLLYLDDTPILMSDEKNQLYTFTIEEDKPHIIKVRVVNKDTDSETSFEIPITIDQPSIIGDLQAFPDTVGDTPFTVTLDASATKVTDPEDAIVYFSRDFDDGEQNQNTSQGITDHTYTYNKQIENGTYNPSVTITTKKGLNKTIHLPKPIMVKKPLLKAMIVVDSHPGQMAKVGDTVEFSIRTDGQPESIEWNFGDGKTIKMDGRKGSEISHIYQVAGEYKVSANIIYDNKTASYPDIKMVISKNE